MKKTLLLMMVTGLAFTSCSQSENTSVTEAEVAKATLNLDNFNYSQVSNVLKGITSSQKVNLVSGGESRVITLSKSNSTVEGEVATLYAGDDKDSLSMVLSPEYASMSMKVQGETINYVDYQDAAKMAEVANMYNKELVQTKAGAGVMTRAVGGGIKLNITKGAAAMPKAESTEPIKVAPTTNSAVASKAGFTRNGVVDVCLYKEKGSWNVNHEITWQINNTISALNKIAPRVKFNFIIVPCDFKGTFFSYNKDIVNFGRYLEKRPSATKYINVLIRYGGWGFVKGLSNFNTYQIDREVNYAVSMSCTNAFYNMVLAHEISHTLGADDVWNPFDLMFVDPTFTVTNQHFNKANKAAIAKSLGV